MQKLTQREIEDPTMFALLLVRRLGLEGDKTAFRDAEEVILDAMNEALDQARAAVVRTPRWGGEAVDSLKVRLNNPK